MFKNYAKNKKAQLSIEFIVLLSIFLLFFQAMVLPMVEFSENTLNDVYIISQSHKSINDLISTIENLDNSQGYGKITYFLYLPNEAQIKSCSDTNITLQYTLSGTQPLPSSCDENTFVCEKEISLNISGTLFCEDLEDEVLKQNIYIEKSEDSDFILLTS